jgi:UDP-glucose 4-epimerase
VYASSSSVYGDAAALPLREDAACWPVSPYGVTKLAAEHLGHLYRASHGLPVVSLRYFTVYGPRQRPDMAFHRFLKAARDAAPITVYGDGGQTRDFTFVADIVAATRAAADRGRPGRVYNVGGGERVTLNDVLDRIGRVTGRRLDVRRGEAQKGDMRDTFADTSAAREDLGFRSTVPLDEGLRREWDWIRGLP